MHIIYMQVQYVSMCTCVCIVQTCYTVPLSGVDWRAVQYTELIAPVEHIRTVTQSPAGITNPGSQDMHMYM